MLLQTQKPALRPLTTAHLAQTMTLLELNSFELSQKIEAALSSNPALEYDEVQRCPTCRRRLPPSSVCPICTRPVDVSGEQPVVYVSPREYFHNYQGSRSSVEDSPDTEWVAESETLPVHVLKQIAAELAAEDRPIAAHILTCLDDDGLLRTPLVEIARYHHVLPSRVQKVLQLIQRADPVGVGSASPQEALLVQLQVLSETRPVPPLAFKAIEEGMEMLSRRSYPELGRLLKVSAAEAQEIARFISDNLNPYPGRAHWGESHTTESSPNTYYEPDIVISRLHNTPDSPLVVEVISPYAGRLRVNPLFREALAEAPPDKVSQWQADLEQANLLVKCLQQRDNTLVRLMKRLAVLQRDFILHGDACLNPVTRAQLAQELDVHESTISRAVSGKSIQLPNGRIIPLAKMFDRSLHIRTVVREIIESEKKPLSDTQIRDILRKKGYDVARRTVAKYRSMEGILPARYRQAAVH